MDNETILDGNKIICEFEYNCTDWNLIQKLYCLFVDDLKYHSSWNWLFPVIEKCHMTQYRTTLEGSHLYDSIWNSMNKFDIELTFLRVVFFINAQNTENLDNNTK